MGQIPYVVFTGSRWGCGLGRGREMTARTDRIVKLNNLIAAETAANHPNRAAKFAALRDKFASMSDDSYDYLIALNMAKLADPTINSQDFYRSYYSRRA